MALSLPPRTMPLPGQQPPINVGMAPPPGTTGAVPPPGTPPITGGMAPPASPLTSAMMNPYNPTEFEGGQGVGGVSAVNPTAGAMDYNSLNPFIDASYNQAMTRLNPAFEQQNDRFEQGMVNRGIGVGSEAYNEAQQQIGFGQDDARQNAAFNAMGFGAGIQDQMFGQDATRSGLANSLLQAQWGNELGWGGLNERGRQFDNTFGEGARQFNDMSNRAWDNQGFGQMMGLEGIDFRNQSYNDYRSDYGNSLLMAMLGYGGGQQPQWNADPNSPYNAQLGYGASTYGTQSGLAGNLFGGFGYVGGG